jgi:DNA polymerase (family X)
MTKSEVAAILEEIAALLELKGENPFKIRAYTNAARSLETFGGNLANLQDEEALAKIPGIGESIALKIKELAATGSLKYLKDLRRPFWNCSRFPVWARKKSRPSTTGWA